MPTLFMKMGTGWDSVDYVKEIDCDVDSDDDFDD